MKKVAFITLAFIASYFTGNAQGARIGLTAGVALSNFSAKENGQRDNGTGITGVTAGVLIDLPAGKHFSIQQATNYVEKGTKDTDPMSGSVKININTIEVALNFLYNTRGDGGNFYIGAGPTVTYALSGEITADFGTGPNKLDMKFGNGDDDNMRRLDVGANLLTGYCFSNGLFLSANYNLGLRNLFPGGSSDDKLNSRYFGIKLGWLLKSKVKN
jgi:hypothetical protein